jgi:acetyl esterase
MLNIMASLYDGVNSKNPLAWPYHADLEMLKGLPPHVISVNELDPLRDEGLEFYKKLKNAGVSAKSKVIKGTVHASEGIFPTKIPEIHNSALEDIKNFAYSLE